MSGAPLVSDLVGAVIKSFRSFQHEGVFLDPQTLETLIRNLRTIQELSRDQEEELEIQFERERNERSRQALRDQRFAERVDANMPTNVVRLPIKPRLVLRSSDGGDAA